MTCNVSLEASVAASLETERALLPYMPELLEDLWALGTDPEMVVRLLRPWLSAGAHVLDLACGKGAVSVALAAQLGCRVTGVDGMPAFITTARSMAKGYGVSHLCAFTVGDIRDYRAPDDVFDAVIMGATGPILGSLRETVGRVRGLVKPGGVMVLDDAWPVDADAHTPSASCRTREEVRAALVAHGDEIVAEEIIPVASMRMENTLNNTRIQQRVDALAKRHPDCAAQFCAYASRQLFECYLLENVYRCALWVVRTSANKGENGLST